MDNHMTKITLTHGPHVSCYYTKEAFVVANHTAATVADKLVQEVFLRFGFPIQIHSDQGRELIRLSVQFIT